MPSVECASRVIRRACYAACRAECGAFQGRRTAAAFTLIELLVVMGILAVLISILLPAMSAARQSGQSAACLANMHRLGVSTAMYLEKSEGQFFPFRLSTVNGSTYVNEFGASQPRWQWFLGFELGAIIDPPRDSSAAWGDSFSTQMTNDYFVCPSLVGEFRRDIRNGAYGYNYQYLGNSRTETSPPDYDNFPVSENQISAPGLTVLIADSRGAGPAHGVHSYTLDPPRLARERNAARFGPSSGGIPHSPAEPRHRGKAAVSFVDGHAEAMTVQQLGYESGSDGIITPIDNIDHPNPANRLWTGRGEDAPQRRRLGR